MVTTYPVWMYSAVEASWLLPLMNSWSGPAVTGSDRPIVTKCSTFWLTTLSGSSCHTFLNDVPHASTLPVALAVQMPSNEFPQIRLLATAESQSMNTSTNRSTASVPVPGTSTVNESSWAMLPLIVLVPGVSPIVPIAPNVPVAAAAATDDANDPA